MTTKIIIQNTNCEIQGIVPLLVKKVLSAYVTGYKYTPQYKYSNWDGKSSVLINNIFPTGLLNNVVEAFQKERVQFELQDNRFTRTLQLKSTAVELRDYQANAIHKAVNNTLYDSWWPRGTIKLATAGGKTIIATALIQQTAVPTLFLAHRIDLIEQAKEKFNHYGLSVGEVTSKKRDFSKKVTVSTIQTLLSFKKDFDKKKFYKNKFENAGLDIPIALTEKRDNWEDKLKRTADRDIVKLCEEAWANKNNKLQQSKLEVEKFFQKIEMVIIDEAHLISGTVLGASMFSEALSMMPNAYMRYGLTATPNLRDEFSNLVAEGGTGGILCNIESQELIQQGYLSDVSVTMYVIPKDGMFKGALERWPECYDHGIVTYAPRNQKIVDKALALGGPTLILVNRVGHGNLLQDMLESQRTGLTVPFIKGEDDIERRRQVAADLNSGKTNLAIASTVWDEGIDIPNLRTVILAGGGKSTIKNLQRVGRGMRIGKDKTELKVIDFYDKQTKKLADHSKERERLWISQGFKVTVDVR